ncbi:MAG: MG2 domain-containing protein [Vulcanimicrobiota bacterium]
MIRKIFTLDNKIKTLIIVMVFLGILLNLAISRETPRGAITGTVIRNDNKTPIKGAIISHPVRDTYVKTDQQGSYTLYGVPTGETTVRVHAKGFSHSYRNNVKVEEGRTTENINFELIKKKSYFHIYAYQKVFKSSENPRINTRGYMVKNIRYNVYKINPLTNLAIMSDYRAIQHLDLSNMEPYFSRQYPNTFDLDGNFNTNIELPLEANGLYIIEAKAVGGQQARRTWVLKSDLGLILKRSPQKLLVYAQNLSSGEPVKGATIRVFSNNQRIAIGQTDKNGLLTLNNNIDNSFKIAGNLNNNFALARTYRPYSSQNYRSYVYTERPVYRPGQTVFFKGIVRKKFNHDYINPHGIQARVKVTDTSGNVIYNKDVYTNDFGSFYDSFRLREEPPLGVYNIKTTVMGSESYSSFKVSEYRKPEYKIEVSTDKPRYIAGDTIKVKVRGSYYFGAPTAGTSFYLTVYESAYSWGRDSWANYYTGDSGGYGGIMFETQGTLNENGEAVIQIPTDKIEHSKYLRIEVEAKDISGRSVTGSTNVPLSVGEFALYSYTDKYVYNVGEQVKVNVEALDYDEKPVPNQQVSVEVNRLTYEEMEVKRTYNDANGNPRSVTEYKIEEKSEKIHTTSLTTNSRGQAEFELIPEKAGSYMTRVYSRDVRGNRITYNSYFYVAEEGADNPAYTEADIKIITDKNKYNPGERASAIISTSQPNSWVLITIEGRELFHYELVKINKGAITRDYFIDDKYFPNFYISATTIKDMDMIYDTKEIKLERKQKELDIVIKPNRDRYKPGEKAVYTLTARDRQGNPVQAELSLGVVDQAIYAIAPDETPDIKEFFWGYEYNMVDTTYSFAKDYSGGADKDQPIKVRKKFVDTAFWSPTVRTDKNGNATIEFTMPDNLTTWVNTARAVTMDTKVGAMINTVLCTKPLLVRLETPRFLTQRDIISIGGIVHNYTDQDQDVKVWLESTGVKPLDETKHQDKITPDSAKDYYWAVEAEEPGMAKFILYCKGQADSDAMELKVPIHPFGIEEINFAQEKIENNETTAIEEIMLPENVEEKASSMEIILSPSLAATLFEDLDYLIHYPYGCVEQTMSSFAPALIVTSTFNQLKLKDENLQNKIPKIVRKGLARLYQMQHYDGGWGWWSDDDTNPNMTAYVVIGLKEAEQQGYDVSEYALQKGIEKLTSWVSEPVKPVKTIAGYQEGEEWNTRAYLVYALYRVHHPVNAHAEKAFENRENMNVYAKALLALTMKGIKEEKKAEVLLNEIENSETKTENDEECYWDSRTFYYSWTDNRVESTAYCLLAYLSIRPSDKKIDKIVNWLTRQRVNNMLTSTKEKAAVVKALTTYLKQSHELSPDYNLRVSLNDKQLVNHYVSDYKLPSNLATLRIPYTQLQTGKNRIKFEKDGPGKLYYTTRLKYFPDVKEIKEKAQGLKITRDYYISSIKKGPQGTFMESKIPFKGEIKRGEKLRVIITIIPDRDFQYLLVEDPLPAGLEVDIAEADKNQGSEYWLRREVRDEKVAFFIRRVEKGKKIQLSYKLRSEMFGTVNALPTLAYCMYSPEDRGHSKNDVLKIEGEK